jgi:hypothetical protein
MSKAVAAGQRFRKNNACPICGGHVDEPRGDGRRCFGFLSADGAYAHCTREDRAGTLPMDPDSNAYAHRLVGPCKCGTEHNPLPLTTSTNGHKRRVMERYQYRAPDGGLLVEVERLEPKDFRQRRPDSRGGWVWNLEGITPVLYRLPELLAANPTAPVFVVEGEKDVEALRALGYVATCNPMGAKKWRESYTMALLGREVIVIPDNDMDGRAHLQQISWSFQAKGQIVKTLELPGVPEHGDMSDWLMQGHTAEDFSRLATQAVPFALAAEQHTSASRDGDEPSTRDRTSSSWPTLDTKALHGLAGILTMAIDPYTEADPVAVLLNILAGFGNLIGAGPHFRVEHTRHSLRLFVVLVGQTARGRKGASWSTPRYLFSCIDELWAKDRMTHGLSTGEGLIYHVRDARVEKQAIKEHNRVVDYEEVVVDHGVSDKRLMIVEEEFSQALKVMSREGNILSPTLRQAWDTGDLHPLTKSNPIRATGAHITVIGHITRDELLRHLSDTEQANGFANRFLWACVKRSKQIPDPQGIPLSELNPLIVKLQQATEAAKHIGEMQRDPTARARWSQIYAELSAEKPGLLGAITARAEAQVMRLACIYAALDSTSIVSCHHLEAALAVWRYCEASAKCIFGDSTGNPVADQLLTALHDGPMDRTTISTLCGRNIPSNRIEHVLEMLQAAHRITVEEIKNPRGGRPLTVVKLA